MLTSASSELTRFRAFMHPLTGTRIEPYITRLMGPGGGPGGAFMPYVRTAPFGLAPGRKSVLDVALAAAVWYAEADRIAFDAIPAGAYRLSFRINGKAGGAGVAVASNVVDLVLP